MSNTAWPPAGFVPSLATNRIKSFVFRWYATFDSQTKEVGDVLALLSPRELYVRFPGPIVMRSREEFGAFYTGAQDGLLASAHHVHSIQVARAADGTFNATIEVLYQRVREGKGALSDLAAVSMTIADAEGRLEITRYDATFLRPDSGVPGRSTSS